MASGIENQHVCDRCFVTRKPGCYLAYYLNLSSGEFTITLSHMCGSWYLPMSLLRDGSLTLMKMASLMDLGKFWSSLPRMLKLSIDISWPVVLWWSWMGDGVFMCSFYLSADVLSDSLMYSSSQRRWVHSWCSQAASVCQITFPIDLQWERLFKLTFNCTDIYRDRQSDFLALLGMVI